MKEVDGAAPQGSSRGCFHSPVQPWPSSLRCIPGGQMHTKEPIMFLQVIPLESQSSSPSEHSS